MMIIGITLLLVTVVLFGYGEYERLRFEREQAIRDRGEAVTATVAALAQDGQQLSPRTISSATAPSASSEPRASADPDTATQAVAGAAAPVAVAQPSAFAAGAIQSPAAAVGPAPIPSITAQPVAQEIRRVVAATIDLDAPVVLSKVENGEWQVPKFVAGHLEGTAMPGSGSNVVLSGHVQSLTSGNVFARIDELESGDEIVLRTDVGQLTYRIVGKSVVRNDDLSVVQPTEREELTLITCTGTFNPLTQDYSHRIVVWAERLG